MRPYQATEVIDRRNTPLDEINFVDLYYCSKCPSYILIAKKYIKYEEVTYNYVVALVDKSVNRLIIRCTTENLEDALMQADIYKDVVNANHQTWIPNYINAVLVKNNK